VGKTLAHVKEKDELDLGRELKNEPLRADVDLDCRHELLCRAVFQFPRKQRYSRAAAV
jgi:hypothetical protein